MKITKFKVGDKVVVVRADDESALARRNAERRSTGTITKLEQDGCLVFGDVVNSLGGKTGYSLFFLFSELQLCVPRKQISVKKITL